MDPELVRIMKELDMAQYISRFTRAGFETWKDVCDILESDLEQLGVKTGHRRRLQRRIATSRGINLAQQLRDPHRIPTRDGVDAGREGSSASPMVLDGEPSASWYQDSASNMTSSNASTRSLSTSGSPALMDGQSSSRKRKSATSGNPGRNKGKRPESRDQDEAMPSSSRATDMPTPNFPQPKDRFQDPPPPPQWADAQSPANPNHSQDVDWGSNAYLGANNEMQGSSSIGSSHFTSSLSDGILDPMLATPAQSNDPSYDIASSSFPPDGYMFATDVVERGDASTNLYPPPPSPPPPLPPGYRRRR